LTISINQPAYIPWLGYYHRMAQSDKFVFLDHVQFEKNSFINRNKIRVSNGSAWLTIPVKTSGKYGDLAINKLEVIDNGWRKKHLDSIRMNYARTPGFDLYYPQIELVFKESTLLIAPFLFRMNELFMKLLGIETTVIKSSELDLQGSKSDLILEICLKLNAKKYFSGKLGKDYLDLQIFEDKGIEVVFQDYVHPIYTQKYPDFEPYMSVIDLIMNHGSNSLNIILENNLRFE
jgi:hypothetical protein